MTVMRLFDVVKTVPGLPSSRCCGDCGRHDESGTLGPPKRIVGECGLYWTEDLSETWFCTDCSAIHWSTWKTPDVIARRRAEVFAEVARRREAMASWQLSFGWSA